MSKIKNLLLIAITIITSCKNVKGIDWQNAADGQWAMGCDFIGKDLTNELSRGQDCSGRCKLKSGCTHYAWNNYNGGTCWMKSNGATKADAIQKDKSYVCGILSTSPTQDSVTLTTINNCPYSVWVGMQGRSRSNPNWVLPNNGGWELKSGQSKSVNVPKDYNAGRLWGRTNCNYNSGTFRCETGDCGPWVECATGGVQRGGQTPASLAEFTLNGWGNQDYYDVSLVDGYNLKISIEVTNPTVQDNKYWCKNPACVKDLNSICPNELKKFNSAGQVIGCLSACEKFNTDQYCCRGKFGTPDTCKSIYWPVNFPSVFKNACPDAYSYAYDDHTSTFFCRNTNYNIKFC